MDEAQGRTVRGGVGLEAFMRDGEGQIADDHARSGFAERKGTERSFQGADDERLG